MLFFGNSVNTPAPVAVGGIVHEILVAAAVVAIGTGITRLVLLARQQAQADKQLAEQEELSKLQKKLAQEQLKQYETQEKEMNLFKAPSVGMTTRSMVAGPGMGMARSISNANLFNNIELGNMQRGSIRGFSSATSSTESLNLLNRQGPMTSFGSTTTLGSRSILPATSSRQSLVGSTDSLNTRHAQFARGLQGMPTLAAHSDDMLLKYRGPAEMQPSVQVGAGSPKLYSTPKPSKPLPIIPTRPRDSMLDLTQNSNFDHVPRRSGFSPFGRALPRGTVTPRPSVTLLKTMKSITRRIRSVLPVRAAGNRGGLATSLILTTIVHQYIVVVQAS